MGDRRRQMRLPGAVTAHEQQPPLRIVRVVARHGERLAQPRRPRLEALKALLGEGVEAEEAIKLALPSLLLAAMPFLHLALFAGARHRLPEPRIAEWHVD